LRLKPAFSCFIDWVIYPTEVINDQAITTSSGPMHSYSGRTDAGMVRWRTAFFDAVRYLERARTDRVVRVQPRSVTAIPARRI
jgi:hypothetical protein